MNSDDRIDIERALDTLTQKQRAVFVMIIMGDKTQAEVARLMGVTQPTVHKHLHVAIRKVRAYRDDRL